MRGIVNDVPVGLLTALVVGGVLALVMAGVWVVRRHVPGAREGFDAEVSSQMLGVVASLFGLLLAFVVVVTYQAVGDAQSNVDLEANSLASIVRDVQVLPPADVERVNGAVAEYARAVVGDEWPGMRTGSDSKRSFAAIAGIYTALQAVEPQSERAKAFYDDAVQQLSVALNARRDRLSTRDGGLSPLLLALILVGALVILGYATLVGSRSAAFHLVGAGSIAVLVGFAIVVLIALSYPFSGSLAIDSKPLQQGVLAQFFQGN